MAMRRESSDREGDVSLRSPDGFTLVELLIVLAIIGVLMALLLPAVQSARESSRRATCGHNMRQIGIALFSAADQKNAFPGYVAAVPKKVGSMTVQHRASWVVTILPHLERNDLYQSWFNPSLTFDLSQPTTRGMYVSPIAVLACPSNINPDPLDNPLSFVVNTGSAITANDNLNVVYAMPNWKADANSGVFFNKSGWDYLPGGRPTPDAASTSAHYLNKHDGTSSTLMLSENLQATYWATDPTRGGGNKEYQSDFAVRQSCGFVWFVTGNPNNEGPPRTQPTASFAAQYLPAGMNINGMSTSVSPPPSLKFNTSAPSTTQPSGLALARPSSSHAGGVNAVFCDAHLKFVSEEIEYHVYTQLMTPQGAQVTVDYDSKGKPIAASATGGTSKKVSTPWTYALIENDYR